MPVISLSGHGLPADQIHRQLGSVIAAGQLAAGEKLPSVRQLARDLNVAAGTVAKAYKLLEQDGLVTSQAGGGTRVSARVTTTPTEVLRAARALADVAQRYGLSHDEAVGALQASWPRDDQDAPASPGI
ncbi:GntR family transcriptional regulator [Leifsonia kafniensis]|uniref:GntR family transcriptional regulator n=1 Tax=Leifsonia kafniensis TaxID=475957 RepID=A0ABP7K8I7_9MICO